MRQHYPPLPAERPLYKDQPGYRNTHMPADYQQLNDPMTGTISETVLRRVDSAYIPNDGANRDRQMYEEWLAEGNTPDPPEPLPAPSAASHLTLEDLDRRLTALERR